METNEIFNNALNSNYLIVEEEDLKIILENSEILRTEDTHLSDFIRLIKFEARLFIQE